MTHIVSFGGYNFDARGIHFETNFANVVPRTTRLPGMDGGYDEFGDGLAPSEIGRVTARLRYAPGDVDAMYTLRDALRGLANRGRGTLIMQPGTALAQRWTLARINSVQITEKMPAFTDTMQEISVDWQVSASRWYSDNPDVPSVHEDVADEGTFTLVTNGNALAAPVVTVVATTPLAGGLTVQLAVDADVVDQVAFGSAIPDGGTLVIDCRALSVTLNGANAYGTAFAVQHPAWLRLRPGVDNDFIVQLGGGETADVTVTFDDTWY